MVRNSAYHSSFEQINKYGLQMFYTADFDNVFFADDMGICISEVYDGGIDYRLFYRGKGLESIKQDKLYFPDLSHA